MNGMLYGIGVGPGDPELMTLKALRLIRESSIVAVPGTEAKESVAWQIAEKACPELKEKPALAIPMPMTKDPEVLERLHAQGAETILAHLRAGEQVAFLTLGDPTVYSTYLYLHRRVQAAGFPAEIVSGVPSFCAVAARMDIGLAEKSEQLHIIPAAYGEEQLKNALALPGTKVLMKTGRSLEAVREYLVSSGKQAVLAENCGMDSEKLYRDPAAFPDSAGYYSLMIVKG